MTLADKIRDFVQQNYIEPARRRGDHKITIRAGDIHSDMQLESRMPAVCGALGTKKFEDECGVSLIRRKGPSQGANVYFTFEILFSDSETQTVTFIKQSKSTSRIKNLLHPKIGKMTPEEFENICMEVLSEFFGTPLTKGQVKGIPKTFDLVSSDEEIVGDAKYLTMVRGEFLPPAKFSMIAEHVWLLERISAKHKFLVFGNDRRVPEKWLKRYGHLVEDVEFFFLNSNKRLEKLK